VHHDSLLDLWGQGKQIEVKALPMPLHKEGGAEWLLSFLEATGAPTFAAPMSQSCLGCSFCATRSSTEPGRQEEAAATEPPYLVQVLPDKQLWLLSCALAGGRRCPAMPLLPLQGQVNGQVLQAPPTEAGQSTLEAHQS